MSDFRLPSDKERTVIVGRTGSGKTVAGIWHLSKRDYLNSPWVLFDYKGDELIEQLPITEIPMNKLKPPENAGLYVVRPLAEVDDAAVENFLWAIKNRGNTGIYIDEGYMLPGGGRSMAYRAIQTQGRSLKIPTITLSQRPVWMDRFVFSEADFYQVFHLNDKRDRKTIGSFMPDEASNAQLPEFWSHYYDVKKNNLFALKPVPHGDALVSTFIPPEPPRRGLFSI